MVSASAIEHAQFVRKSAAGMVADFRRSRSQRVRIEYTNWKGFKAERLVTPQYLWFGATEWHAQEQWLLRAFDHGKNEHRDFAMQDISAWEPA